LELRLEGGEQVYEHRFVLATSEGIEAQMVTDIDEYGPLDFALSFLEPEAGMIDMSVTIHIDGEKLGAPRIVFPLSSPGAWIQIPAFTLDVTTSREPPKLGTP